MQTLRLSAALAALILAASTAWAGVIDLSNGLGPSGGYTSRAYYQGMLGGQLMTADQQAYADHEDQLRQAGYQAELGGDYALGQMFYHMAYGVTPPQSALDLGSGSSSTAPGGPGTGSSYGSDGGSSYGSSAGSSYGSSDFSDVATQLPSDPGTAFAAVPEASTWAMMVLGLAGLVYAGRRGSRKPALHAA